VCDLPLALHPLYLQVPYRVDHLLEFPKAVLVKGQLVLVALLSPEAQLMRAEAQAVRQLRLVPAVLLLEEPRLAEQVVQEHVQAVLLLGELRLAEQVVQEHVQAVLLLGELRLAEQVVQEHVQVVLLLEEPRLQVVLLAAVRRVVPEVLLQVRRQLLEELGLQVVLLAAVQRVVPEVLLQVRRQLLEELGLVRVMALRVRQQLLAERQRAQGGVALGARAIPVAVRQPPRGQVVERAVELRLPQLSEISQIHKGASSAEFS
jgi:hypothetical protein